jgi:hypothetical protein
LQDPPKFTQIGIFGLKICHLATLEYGANLDSQNYPPCQREKDRAELSPQSQSGAKKTRLKFQIPNVSSVFIEQSLTNVNLSPPPQIVK